jgi:hypothetical protein
MTQVDSTRVNSGPVDLGPAQWTDLNEVPPHRRKLDGNRLTLEQINTLARREHELGGWKVIPEVENGKFWDLNEGAARLEFMTNHHAENGIWVDGGPA